MDDIYLHTIEKNAQTHTHLAINTISGGERTIVTDAIHTIYGVTQTIIPNTIRVFTGGARTIVTNAIHAIYSVTHTAISNAIRVLYGGAQTIIINAIRVFTGGARTIVPNAKRAFSNGLRRFGRGRLLFIASCAAISALSYYLLNIDVRASLLPHKIALEYFFNTNFVYVDGLGYAEAGGFFAITQNCMGAKLFVCLFMITAYCGGDRIKTPVDGFILAAKYFITSISAAFAITMIRIIISAPFCASERFYLLHNTLSLFIYFGSCLAVYHIMRRAPKNA